MWALLGYFMWPSNRTREKLALFPARSNGLSGNLRCGFSFPAPPAEVQRRKNKLEDLEREGKAQARGVPARFPKVIAAASMFALVSDANLLSMMGPHSSASWPQTHRFCWRIPGRRLFPSRREKFTKLTTVKVSLFHWSADSSPLLRATSMRYFQSCRLARTSSTRL
jgi:hypothetical protein